MVVSLHEIVSNLLFFNTQSLSQVFTRSFCICHISSINYFLPLSLLFLPNQLVSQYSFQLSGFPQLVTKLAIDVLLIIVVVVYKWHILVTVITINNNFLFLLVKTLLH